MITKAETVNICLFYTALTNAQSNVGGTVISTIVDEPSYRNEYYLDNSFVKLGIGME